MAFLYHAQGARPYNYFINSNAASKTKLSMISGHPKGPAITAVINSYLEQGKSNVVLFNWEEMAASIYSNMISSYLNWAAPNAKKVSVNL